MNQHTSSTRHLVKRLSLVSLWPVSIEIYRLLVDEVGAERSHYGTSDDRLPLPVVEIVNSLFRPNVNHISTKSTMFVGT
jgi:hypothetical protein